PLSVVSAAASPSTPPLSLHDALPICADSELRSAGRALRGALLAGPGAERDGAAKQLQGHFRELQALGSDVGKFFRNADNQARIQRLQGLIRDYESAAMKMLDLLRQGTVAEELRARELLVNEASPKGNEAEALMGELLQIKRTNAHRFEEQMATEQRTAQILIVVLTLGGVILALLLGYLLSRAISRQLGG